MARYTGKCDPVEPLPLEVGDLVKLEEGGNVWWHVKAVSENFVAVTRSEFGHVRYTVLDWRNGVRGPCNLIGQGFGDGKYTEEECAEMLTGFEYNYENDPNYIEAKRAYDAGETERCTWTSPPLDLEVSSRNWMPLKVLEHKKGSAS